MPTTEKEMLRRIAAGDRAAGGWIYDQCAGRLLRRLRSRYGELDAEELLHDAFLLCLKDDAALLRRGLERLPPEARTVAGVQRLIWDQACGIATNRRRASSHRNVVALFDGPRPSGDASPEQTSLARDTLRRLDDCLGENGTRVHLYFRLRYVDGLKPREIMQSTGWSPKATYKLKESLDDAVGRCAERLGLEVE